MPSEHTAGAHGGNGGGPAEQLLPSRQDLHAHSIIVLPSSVGITEGSVPRLNRSGHLNGETTLHRTTPKTRLACSNGSLSARVRGRLMLPWLWPDGLVCIIGTPGGFVLCSQAAPAWSATRFRSTDRSESTGWAGSGTRPAAIATALGPESPDESIRSPHCCLNHLGSIKRHRSPHCCVGRYHDLNLGWGPTVLSKGMVRLGSCHSLVLPLRWCMRCWCWHWWWCCCKR